MTAADRTGSLSFARRTSSAICSKEGKVGSRCSTGGKVAKGATERGTMPHLYPWVSAALMIMWWARTVEAAKPSLRHCR